MARIGPLWVWAMVVSSSIESARSLAADDVGTSIDSRPAVATPTTIRVWFGLGGGFGATLGDMVEQFNSSQEQVRVELSLHAGYGGTLQDFRQALTEGDPPELAVIEVHSVTGLAASGQLASFENLLDNDTFNANDLFIPTLYNLRWNGRLYAVPVNRSVPVLYFNKQRFRDAGLDPNRPPQTWTEFREAARKLSTDPERRYGFAAAPSIWVFEALVFGAGGELLSSDSRAVGFAQPGARVLQIWADMIHQDQSARLADLDAFVRGEAAMFFESTALLASLELTASGFEVGTAFVPHEMDQNPGVPTGGGAAVMPASLSTERREAARKFLAWFTSSERTAEWSRRTGYLPLRKSAVERLTREGFYKTHPNYGTAVAQIEFAREVPTLPAWGAARGRISAAMRQVLEQNVSAEPAMQQAATDVAALLAKSSAAVRSLAADGNGTRRALIICGHPGDDEHRKQFADTVEMLRTALVTRFHLNPDSIWLLFGGEDVPPDVPQPNEVRGPSTRESIIASVESIKELLKPEDSLWVWVIGHSHLDRQHSWFNLPGPDLNEQSFGKCFEGLSCREQVFWITIPASGYYIKPLSASGRVIITATEADREINETTFPHELAKLLAEPPARDELDVDKDGTISLLDIYLLLTRRIAQAYADQKQVSTEHAQLDDNGDGRGTEVQLDYLSEELGGRNRSAVTRPPAADGRLSAGIAVSLSEPE